jgi:hypothetical protein
MTKNEIEGKEGNAGSIGKKLDCDKYIDTEN